MKRSSQLELSVSNLLNTYKIPFLRIDNYRCFRCGQIQNSKAKGFPDFFCYTLQLAIECKTGAGRLTLEQKEIKAKMEESGIKYIVLRDKVDELLTYIQEVLT